MIEKIREYDFFTLMKSKNRVMIGYVEIVLVDGIEVSRENKTEHLKYEDFIKYDLHQNLESFINSHLTSI